MTRTLVGSHTYRLGGVMKSSFTSIIKFAFILVVAVFGVGLTTAHADSFTTVNVSGSFTGGTSLTGTLTIDTTTGLITGGLLTTTGTLAGTFSFSSLTDQMGDGPMGYVADFSSGGVFLSLVFFTSNGTLVSYSGGGFCIGDTAGCGDPSELFNDSTTELMSSGSAVASAVPEPSTYLLLGGGLIGLALLGRKRLVANT